MASWECFEFAAQEEQGGCEMYLNYPRDAKENSNTLEAKLIAAGFSSIMLLTFPNDGSKTAAACVSRIRAKLHLPGYSYCKLGSHDPALEGRLNKPQARNAHATPVQNTEREFDEKTKAVMEATQKKVDDVGESVAIIMKDMPRMQDVASTLDDRLAPIVRKEDMAGLADKEDTSMLSIQVADMGSKLSRMNATIDGYEANMKVQQATIKSQQATIERLEGSIKDQQATIAGLQMSAEAHNKTIRELMVSKHLIEARRDEYEQKAKQQGYKLAELRPIQTKLGTVQADLIAMTNYRDAAERREADGKAASDAIIEALRRDLHAQQMAQDHLRIESQRILELERVQMRNERNAWAREREGLVAAAGNNASVMMSCLRERVEKTMDEFEQSLKRPREAEDVAGDGA